MKFVLFYHSLVSDWNHGNAHFLRGMVAELQARGHAVDVWEPLDGWSRSNQLADGGVAAEQAFAGRFPTLHSQRYAPDTLDLDRALDGADVVIVHEWNPPPLVARIGRHRRRDGAYTLLFHDTHHRSVSAPQEMAAYDLRDYDGVLAFGEAVRQRYLAHGWHDAVWTWHEAADTRQFFPRARDRRDGDLVWIGNWGDDERARELEEFLVEPVQSLGLGARVHGVRYPDAAVAGLEAAGIEYRGWLANHDVPQTFARHDVTVHVPRRFYARVLPGIPTIRVFEALACGIPLVSAPWDDAEGLFSPGEDFLIARDGEAMRRHLRLLLRDRDAARAIAARGLDTLRARHTCAHRADELMDILARLRAGQRERRIACA